MNQSIISTRILNVVFRPQIPHLRIYNTNISVFPSVNPSPKTMATATFVSPDPSFTFSVIAANVKEVSLW